MACPLWRSDAHCNICDVFLAIAIGSTGFIFSLEEVESSRYSI